MITLINGPYNGRKIEDRGTAVIVMCLYDGGDAAGATVGEALYEPNQSRTLAFWNGNTWLGTLEERVPA